jgi:hypothetical protein
VFVAKCKGFRTYKERGEWVELRFMAEALRQGFRVSKPWGDSSAYDVGVEAGEGVLRVQVKSTDCRTQYGYLCQFKPNARSRPYTLKQVDFFVAYVIPAAVILRGEGIKATTIKAMTLLPEKARHPERYRFEGYREAWELMDGRGAQGRGICGFPRASGESAGANHPEPMSGEGCLRTIKTRL